MEEKTNAWIRDAQWLVALPDPNSFFTPGTEHPQDPGARQVTRVATQRNWGPCPSERGALQARPAQRGGLWQQLILKEDSNIWNFRC